MSEDEAKQSERNHKVRETTSKSQSVEKNGKTQEQKKTSKRPARESHSRKKVPSRKRIIEKKETTALSSAIDLNLQETTEVNEEQLVHRLDATMITIDGTKYEIVKEYKEAFDGERLGERYSEILDKYDYIVADWGFEQLRLKGFYDNRNRKVPQDQRINNLEDYLYEYCNFGCPYFVVHRLEAKKNKPKKESADKTEKPVRRKRNQKSKNSTNQKQEMKKPVTRAEVEKDKKPSNERLKPKPKSKPKPKRDFVKKEVAPTPVEKKEKQENTTFKPTNETKGKRHFSIRRKTSETDKNNE
ncbi:YutD family protein [Carnobacterium funditum]|uniref:YutD family protein n=1 Tax=Carnobacterium funditum TaxID=2752 RepID=UPI00068D7E8F|nr:YutD family protein [Carnobacterium funditum]